MATKVYIASTLALENANVFASIYEQAPVSRKERVDRFKFDEDKRLSLAAWKLLEMACRDFGITKMPEWSFEEKGKPYFKEYPAIHFNLSHSHNRVMAIVSDECEVGCDIEICKDGNLDLVERFFSEEEKKVLEAEEKDVASKRFYQLWTLKESFMKCTGRGLSLPLHSFSMQINENPIRVKWEGEGTYSFFCFENIPQYAAACCLKNDVQNAPEMKEINF